MKKKLLRTYEAIKAAPLGIHSFELMRLAGTTRVAARVNDLKKQGYVIESRRATANGVEGCVYKLVGDAKMPLFNIKPVYVLNRNTGMMVQQL